MADIVEESPRGWQLPEFKLLASLVVILPLLFWLKSNLVFIVSNSIDNFVVWLAPQRPIKAGRLVMFSMDSWPDVTKNPLLTEQKQQWLKQVQGKKLVKRLGCMERQRLYAFRRNEQQTEYYCEGSFVASAARHPESHFLFNGLIPYGYAFVVGDHPESLDSRYFGLVEITKAQRVLSLRELLLEEEE